MSQPSLLLADALRALEDNEDGTFVRLLERPTFDVSLYKPVGLDQQGPHTRDELYIIANGTGTFHCDGSETEFQRGDAFFVPAGVEHCFVDFSPEFSAWVIFFLRGVK